MKLQTKRTLTQISFFALFILAPVLDIFRLDLYAGHFFFFGLDWTLGLDAFIRSEIGIGQAFANILFRGFLPIATLLATFFWISWRFGRLYCGWLCPHFSIVEMINGLMLKTFARPSIWQRHEAVNIDGEPLNKQPLHWITLGLVIPLAAFIWAFALLTYLLPPSELYPHLLDGEFTRNQFVFLLVATIAFSIDFSLARHLFCRFGCAVGLFQSYVWMFNRKAMVVGFQRQRVKECTDCSAACDSVCPMRLKPRTIKRHMFACTQCHQCIDACNEVQLSNPQGSLLEWVKDADALDVSDRNFGRHPTTDILNPPSIKQEATWKSS